MAYYPLSEFERNFNASLQYEAVVAYWLMMEGFGVLRPSPRVRRETENRLPFESSRDLIVFDGGEAGNRRTLTIEVKSKNVRFDLPDSWPFEDVTLFNANKKCNAFGIVLYSLETDYALGVVRDESWFLGRQADNRPARNGLEYDAVKAPISSLLTWADFVQKLWLALTGEQKACVFPEPRVPEMPKEPYKPEVLSDDEINNLVG